MKKIEELLQQITLTSHKTDIEKIAKQLGDIDNLITGEVLRNVLNTHFQNTILTNAVTELEKLAAQKSSDKQKYDTVLENIVRGTAVAASTHESKSEEPAPIDINENNRIWVFQLVTLLKGLYQRSVYNNANGGMKGKIADRASQSYTGRTRLQIAENFETAANNLLSRLTPAPVSGLATKEHPITNILGGVEQKIQQLKEKITTNEHPQVVEHLLKDISQLKNELDTQHLAFHNKKTEAINECKQYQSNLDTLSKGEIPDVLLATVDTEKDEKLQPLVDAWQSGRNGSYYSPTAWSNWYSLDATEKNLNEALQIRFQNKINSAQREIKENTLAIRDCESLIHTAAAFEQNLILTKELEHCQILAGVTDKCIKLLEADLAKLSSRWVKVKNFLTRKSTERKHRIEQKTLAKSELIAKKEELVAKLSTCNYALFNSANPQLFKKSGNELAHQPASPA